MPRDAVQSAEIVDRVAVVTGGGSGLGRATVQTLVRAGALVAVLDRNFEAARALAVGAGDAVLPVSVDVGHRASVADAIDEVVEVFGRIDICVNAAGVPNPGKVLGTSGPLPSEDFQRVIDVNLVGAFDVMRRCADVMARNPGVGRPDAERGVVVNVLRNRLRRTERAVGLQREQGGPDRFDAARRPRSGPLRHPGRPSDRHNPGRLPGRHTGGE